MKPTIAQSIYQFKITLRDIEPLIWRRVQVPAKYSFWDLHVAIQDAMGWLDYHLHAFHMHPEEGGDRFDIGIPDEPNEPEFFPGWEIPITEHFTKSGQTIEYVYDFGDGWGHDILFEEVLARVKGDKYPKCVAGERACPPEDCGSIPGYYRVVDIVQDPKHEEYEEVIGWLRGHAKNYFPYKPDEFFPDKVRFDSPKRRLKLLFEDY